MNSDKKGEDEYQQQQSQNPTNQSNRSTELTAEWTVHAQLTISRPDDPSAADDRQNPVRVIYKWSSDNAKPTTDDQPTYQDANSFSSKNHRDSFHSTTTTGKLPSDSGHSSSNTSRKPYGARCKSTCSIVLSAVADFLPNNADIPEEPDPFYFNTTSTYNVHPDQTIDESTTTNVSQNFGTSKILSLRDAFSQTSDTESTKLHTILNRKGSIGSKDEIKQRRLYNYRRQTESLLPPPAVDEGDQFLPSYAKSSSQQQSSFYASSTNLQSQRSGSRGDIGGGSQPDRSDPNAKKPPRTVHIDVYCTGSDAEDDDDDDDEIDDASSQSSNNLVDIESNSTPQTVLNTEQMHLRHQRAGKNELPRRLVANSQQQQQDQMHNRAHKQQQQQSHQQTAQTHVYDSDSQILPHLGHTLSHSNTADEISESKQILFKKHIGDQKSKFNFRNRYFRRDQSDDAISSNYPNSSRSTMRDMTCSSISSALASTSAIYEDIDTSWKETEPELDVATITSMGKSDSFEYENSVDRARIKTMNRFWPLPRDSSPNELTIPQSSQQRRIQDFLQSYHGPSPRSYHDAFAYDHDHPQQINQHRFSYNRPSIPERDEPMEQQELPPTTQTHRMTLKGGLFQEQPVIVKPEPGRLKYGPESMKSSSEGSTLQSNLSGYTSDYLLKARRFGAVVTALRKPGHHVGPSKNPDCQCEHCRRWLAERVEGRGRAHSIGDNTPFSRSHFWLRRSTPGI